MMLPHFGQFAFLFDISNPKMFRSMLTPGRKEVFPEESPEVEILFRSALIVPNVPHLAHLYVSEPAISPVSTSLPQFEQRAPTR